MTGVGAQSPRRFRSATWIIWACVGIILAASYDAAGATDTLWFPVAFALGFIVIAALSVVQGEGGISLIDLLCLFGAVLSAWAWWEFNSPEIALFATISIDGFGAIPTINKSWREPLKENRLAWSSGFVGSVANVLAINWGSTDYAVCFYPVFMLFETGTITAILFLRQRCILHSRSSA